MEDFIRQSPGIEDPSFIVTHRIMSSKSLQLFFRLRGFYYIYIYVYIYIFNKVEEAQKSSTKVITGYLFKSLTQIMQNIKLILL